MGRLLSLIRLFGINPIQTYQSLKGLVPFWKDARHFKEQLKGDSDFPVFRWYPCLNDRYAEAGVATGHYFHQDIAVARSIYNQNPKRHIDVGSRVDGFVAHVAVFRKIEVCDIRKLTTSADNIIFRQCDLTAPIKDEFIECCDSLSCLHALEHFGLGRYGDPIDVNGHKIALDNLIQMLHKGGRLYLSVPIGPQRIEFNGHRIFSPNYIIGLVSDKVSLMNFSYIADDGEFQKVASYNKTEGEKAYGCNLGVGIFEFLKN